MKYTHFSKPDRLELSILLNRGYSYREIAIS
ncbi:helix-turn-helix domain-containing protein, partial [Patescibacteria group bacterium]|nr:helix-turn-helix domain-containing protein [Patescibacteria group bacterium]